MRSRDQDRRRVSENQFAGARPTFLERFAAGATSWAGSSFAFGTALLALGAWALAGPLVAFSEQWQLIVNTGTTIVTFLMVFLIQRTQNKDSQALHLKLNELLAAVGGASNRLLNLEDLSEDQLQTLRQHFAELGRLASKDQDLTTSHSVEEAERRHAGKLRGRDADAVPQ